MKVEFTQDCEIEVVESFDELLEDVGSITEVFHIGDTVEFEIVDRPLRFDGEKFIEAPDMVNVQFPDGSVSFGISTDWYKEA